MDKTEIRSEIRRLKRENTSLNSNIIKCERIINKLNKSDEKLGSALGSFNLAKEEMDANTFNGGAVDKGKGDSGISKVKDMKTKIGNLITKINTQISNYETAIQNNNRQISRLEYQLANAEE